MDDRLHYINSHLRHGVGHNRRAAATIGEESRSVLGIDRDANSGGSRQKKIWGCCAPRQGRLSPLSAIKQLNPPGPSRTNSSPPFLSFPFLPLVFLPLPFPAAFSHQNPAKGLGKRCKLFQRDPKQSLAANAFCALKCISCLVVHVQCK